MILTCPHCDSAIRAGQVGDALAKAELYRCDAVVTCYDCGGKMLAIETVTYSVEPYTPRSTRLV